MPQVEFPLQEEVKVDTVIWVALLGDAVADNKLSAAW